MIQERQILAVSGFPPLIGAIATLLVEGAVGMVDMALGPALQEERG